MTGDRRFKLDRQLKAMGEQGLDPSELDLLARIVDGFELGASRHAQLAHELLIQIAGSAQSRFDAIAKFIVDTRGAEAPVVAYAVRWLLENDQRSRPALAARAAHWTALIAQLRAKLVAGAVDHLRFAEKLILFDYSGTVADIVEGLAAHGRRPALTIAESRALDGGRPYLRRLARLQLPMRFVFDAALEQELDKAQALLLGAESLTPDGGLINTLGSRGAARLANAHGVPVLGCAELIKRQAAADLSSAPSPVPPRDFSDKLLPGVERSPMIDCRQDELELVPPQLIDYLLTEHGPLRPQASMGVT